MCFFVRVQHVFKIGLSRSKQEAWCGYVHHYICFILRVIGFMSPLFCIIWPINKKNCLHKRFKIFSRPGLQNPQDRPCIRPGIVFRRVSWCGAVERSWSTTTYAKEVQMGRLTEEEIGGIREFTSSPVMY